MNQPTYQELTAPLPVRGADGDEPDLQKWVREGVLHMPGLLTETQINNYAHLRRQVGITGWNSTPYLHYREIRDICLDKRLCDQMRRLTGDTMGLHLNLTGWISSERDWHCDNYLNLEGVDDWYCAVWFALEDIDPRSGPFQYVPGSHRWPVLIRQRIFDNLTDVEQNDPDWPSLTQPWVSSACEREIKRREAEVVTYVPKRGDVLIWHSFLLHRGSKPEVPGMSRRALIAHYSGIHHRPDMKFLVDPVTQGYYADFEHPVQPGFPPATV